jgi:hypothetical protein
MRARCRHHDSLRPRPSSPDQGATHESSWLHSLWSMGSLLVSSSTGRPAVVSPPTTGARLLQPTHDMHNGSAADVGDDDVAPEGNVSQGRDGALPPPPHASRVLGRSLAKQGFLALVGHRGRRVGRRLAEDVAECGQQCLAPNCQKGGLRGVAGSPPPPQGRRRGSHCPALQTQERLSQLCRRTPPGMRDLREPCEIPAAST